MRILFILVFVAVGLNFFAQRSKNAFVLGVKAGFTRSEATCIRINGFQKKGFVGGLAFQLKVSKRWTSELNLLYIHKGSKNKGNPTEGGFGRYELDLHYFEFPVLFQYHLKNVTFEFGPGFGLLVHAFESSYEEGKQNLTIENPVTPRELCFNVGVSYALNTRWTLSSRYTNSLFPVRKNTSTVKKYDRIGTLNCVLAFCLVRTFQLKNKNQKKVKEK